MDVFFKGRVNPHQDISLFTILRIILGHPNLFSATIPWFWLVKILHHMITCTLPKTNKKDAFPKNQSSLPTTNFQVVLLLVLGMVNHVTHHIGSQLPLASKILLPKKENKCQPFHPPKSSSWNIVLLVGPASHLAIFQLLTHPARAKELSIEMRNKKHGTWNMIRLWNARKLLCSNTFAWFHVF